MVWYNMGMFNDVEKQYILKLAHQSIEWYFLNNELMEIEENDVISDRLKEKLSCFVTLTLDEALRGCVGHIEATTALYLDIVKSAVGAAFNDNRFCALSRLEFEKIKIEVSVLSTPVKLKYSSVDELLKKIRVGVDGVVIQKGELGATYLPQVWNDFEGVEKFLGSLCLKAGMGEFEWKEKDVSISVYQVEVVE